MNEPDWYARVAAAIAIILSTVNLVAGRRDLRWRRIYMASLDLAEPLKRLSPAARNGKDRQVLRSLLTPTADAHLSEIDEASETAPTRPLRRSLKTLHRSLVQLRGSIDATRIDEDSFQLTKTESQALHAAATALNRIDRLLAKSKRRGSA